MTTIVHKLEDEDWQILYDMCSSTYLDGECYAFATALHQGLGWPIIGLMQGKVVRHTLVLSPDGQYFDARGYVGHATVGIPFDLTQPYELREITIEELKRPGESDEVRAHSVRIARKIAETLWPSLPWKDSIARKSLAFANALEKLSREHGIWIRAAYPGARSVFSIVEDTDGDEAEYSLWPTVGEFTFTIDRRFSS